MSAKVYTWFVGGSGLFGALLVATLLAQSCVVSLRDPRAIRVQAAAGEMGRIQVAAPGGYRLPELGPPPMPPVDLPIPLRWVPSVKQSLEGVYKAAYAMGLADGFNAGLVVGEAGGQVVGFLLCLSGVVGLTLLTGVIYRCFFYRPTPTPMPTPHSPYAHYPWGAHR